MSTCPAADPGRHAQTGFAGDVSRRDVLRLATLGAASLALKPRASWASAAPAAVGTSAIAAAGSWWAPPELRSRNGVLTVTLTAAATQVPWGNTTRYALTYNGTTPGPTLRVRAGDTLTVILKNHLDTPTNLHTHGLHVSPSGSSDNIFTMVAPGGSATYTYKIPADHASGTYWYHPHHHGFVAEQLAGGLAGALIVEDRIDDQPALTAATERVLVVSDPRIGRTADVLNVTAQQQVLGREGDLVVLNGRSTASVTGAAGTVEQWRIVNACASRYVELRVDGAAMHHIASDYGRFASPQAADTIVLTPGQRAEVLVPLLRPATVTLTATTLNRIGMGMAVGGRRRSVASAGTTSLLRLDVTAGAGKAQLPQRLRVASGLGRADGQRTLVLGGMGMGMSAGQFTIDGKTFDPARIDTDTRLGTTEDWTIVNRSMMDHPFHLHVWPFLVLTRTDGLPPDPGWRDTVNVPAGGAVTIRLIFADYPGTTVYHCHILDHEDLGMMGIIRVT